jgi:hypothetical protein
MVSSAESRRWRQNESTRSISLALNRSAPHLSLIFTVLCRYISIYLQSYSIIDRLREKRFSHERDGHLLDSERDAQSV